MTNHRLVVNECIWIRSGTNDQQYIFRSIRNALIERGITVLTLNGPKDSEGLARIRKAVWDSDAHIMLDVLLAAELNALYPIFKDRKHFSVGLLDWWNNPYWFTKNAEYLTFRNYNGIAVRCGLTSFIEGRQPPWFSLPENTETFQLASAMLRLPALAAAPFLDIRNWLRRRSERFARERMFYFPFSIAAEQVPLKTEKYEYDFCNTSATRGYWHLRDPFASARYNFANLYHDRARITDLILHAENPAYTVSDMRVTGRLNWDDYCRVVRQSRYAICTGGLHQNSVAKYAEFLCLGTPLLGASLPFEYPWLDKCIFPVDTLQVSAKDLKRLLPQAMEQQPALREHCLALRETLLQLYNAQHVLDLLQDQADGKPIPPGYLKPAATCENL